MANPHVYYVIGIGIASLVNFQFVYHRPISILYPKPFDLNAILAAITSGLVFFGVVWNEWNSKKSSHNYKSSLDPNIQREIDAKTIFHRKYYPITNDPTRSVPITNAVIITRTTEREILLTIFSHLSRFQSIMYLYPPFHFFNHAVTIVLYSPLVVFVPMIISIAGILISAALLQTLSYKMHFLFVWINQLIAIVAWILCLDLSWGLTGWIVVPTWLAFIFLVMSRPAADIHILSYTRLETSDIHLGFGYLVEFLFLGLMQYYTVIFPDIIFNTGKTFFDIMARHLLAFACFVFLMGMAGLFCLPIKRSLANTPYVSLLEIKNWIHKEMLVFGNANQVNNMNVPMSTVPMNIQTSNVVFVNKI